MCIAIMIPVGQHAFLTDDILENCYLVNSDGIGYAYPDGKDGLTIKKFMDFEEFLEEWHKDVHVNEDLPIMLHFRATSVGATNLDNCHPFVVNDTQAFCHNGTIHKVPVDPNKMASDTRMFNRLFLRKLPIGWEDNTPTLAMMEHYIGLSKLIVLNADSTFTIVNSPDGEWDHGIWFSNKHYNGSWTRGRSGGAYRDTSMATGKYVNGTWVPNSTPSPSSVLSLAEERRLKNRKDKRQKQITEHTHPNDDSGDGGSSEVMCQFCSAYFDESEIIMVEYKEDITFDVCHNCANKIQY